MAHNQKLIFKIRFEDGTDGGEGTTLRFLVTKFEFYDTFETSHSEMIVTVARMTTNFFHGNHKYHIFLINLQQHRLTHKT